MTFEVVEFRQQVAASGRQYYLLLSGPAVLPSQVCNLIAEKHGSKASRATDLYAFPNASIDIYFGYPLKAIRLTVTGKGTDENGKYRFNVAFDVRDEAEDDESTSGLDQVSQTLDNLFGGDREK